MVEARYVGLVSLCGPYTWHELWGSKLCGANQGTLNYFLTFAVIKRLMFTLVSKLDY